MTNSKFSNIHFEETTKRINKALSEEHSGKSRFITDSGCRVVPLSDDKNGTSMFYVAIEGLEKDNK